MNKEMVILPIKRLWTVNHFQEDEEEGGEDDDDDDDDDGFFVPHGYLSNDEGALEEVWKELQIFYFYFFQ